MMNGKYFKKTKDFLSTRRSYYNIALFRPSMYGYINFFEALRNST